MIHMDLRRDYGPRGNSFNFTNQYRPLIMGSMQAGTGNPIVVQVNDQAKGTVGLQKVLY